MTLRVSTLIGLAAMALTLSACDENGSGDLDNPLADKSAERPAEGVEDHAGEAGETKTEAKPDNGYAYPDGSLYCATDDERLKRTHCRAFDLSTDDASEELAWSVQGHETIGVCKIESGTGNKAGKCVVKDNEGNQHLVRTYHVAPISSTDYVSVVVDPHSGVSVDARCVDKLSGSCTRKPKDAPVAHKHTKDLGDGFSLVFDDNEAHKNDKVAKK